MLEESIVGREAEIAILQEMYESNKAEFTAVYGRRRIGKTYLIRNFFINKPSIFLHATGLKDGSTVQQLNIFSASLKKQFSTIISTPKTWMEAFEFLSEAIKNSNSKEKVIVFLDELPWMTTPKSRLLQALDHYWNTQWVYDKNFKLIICGSAALWMLDNIVNAKGGLHNRLTRRIKLSPFSLYETKEYLIHNNVMLNNDHVLEIYMAIGGVPFYLNEVKPGLSAKQNISKMCFTDETMLISEYDNLLSSLFKHSEIHQELLEILAKRPAGLDKKNLSFLAKKSTSGGRFSKRLNELEAAGFVKKFIPYGKNIKDTYYQLIDEYTIFYLKWIQPNKNRLDSNYDNIIWEQLSLGAGFTAWSGYAFEAICYKHINKIKKALQLERISTQVGNWRYVPKAKSSDRGAQIDLIFDRIDDVISLCEIKYCSDDFTFSKLHKQELLSKQAVFIEQTKCKKQIFWNMITSQPVKRNSYYDELIMHNVVLDDLFK